VDSKNLKGSGCIKKKVGSRLKLGPLKENVILLERAEGVLHAKARNP